MRIIRVFPIKTKATPDDADVRINCGPNSRADEADEIHISVTFTWDLARAEMLAKMWSAFGLVRVGGPALGDRGAEFIPGRYIANGYTIASRGCNNKCWYCYVHKREGGIRELPIVPGNNLLDSNLLQCSPSHIDAVFAMLRGQKSVRFTGGLEASRITPAIASELRRIKPRMIYCANDRPGDIEHLRYAGKNLLDAGFTKASHRLSAYVLCGYKGDTQTAAEMRMMETYDAGFVPYAMLMRNPEDGMTSKDWSEFQRVWCRPVITLANIKRIKWEKALE